MSTTTFTFDEAFEHLLGSWNRHHELRTSGATIDRLASSREDLDRARSLVALAR